MTEAETLCRELSRQGMPVIYIVEKVGFGTVMRVGLIERCEHKSRFTNDWALLKVFSEHDTNQRPSLVSGEFLRAVSDWDPVQLWVAKRKVKNLTLEMEGKESIDIKELLQAILEASECPPRLANRIWQMSGLKKEEPSSCKT